MKVIGVLLFEGYETLDAHGPIQFLGGRPVKTLRRRFFRDLNEHRVADR